MVYVQGDDVVLAVYDSAKEERSLRRTSRNYGSALFTF